MFSAGSEKENEKGVWMENEKGEGEKVGEKSEEEIYR